MAKKVATAERSYNQLDPYPYDIPRILHKWEGGLTGWISKRVDTVEECSDALDEGWQLRPEK